MPDAPRTCPRRPRPPTPTHAGDHRAGDAAERNARRAPLSALACCAFTKMHGAGNDFVVHRPARRPAAARSRALAAHSPTATRRGLRPVADHRSRHATRTASRRTASGMPTARRREQCGNGARCVAAWLLRDGAAPRAGRLPRSTARRPRIAVVHDGDGGFAIAMGGPQFEPERIPLAGFAARRPITCCQLAHGERSSTALRRGVDGQSACGDRRGRCRCRRCRTLGPALQARRHSREAVNVGFAQVLAPDRIRLRVFERGVGETLACGSGACAAVAVLVRAGADGDRDVAVELPGGTLHIRRSRGRRRSPWAAPPPSCSKATRPVRDVGHDDADLGQQQRTNAGRPRSGRLAAPAPDVPAAVPGPGADPGGAARGRPDRLAGQLPARRAARQEPRAHPPPARTVRQRAGERAARGAHAPADAWR